MILTNFVTQVVVFFFKCQLMLPMLGTMLTARNFGESSIHDEAAAGRGEERDLCCAAAIVAASSTSPWVVRVALQACESVRVCLPAEQAGLQV